MGEKSGGIKFTKSDKLSFLKLTESGLGDLALVFCSNIQNPTTSLHVVIFEPSTFAVEVEYYASSNHI